MVKLCNGLIEFIVGTTILQKKKKLKNHVIENKLDTNDMVTMENPNENKKKKKKEKKKEFVGLKVTTMLKNSI